MTRVLIANCDPTRAQALRKYLERRVDISVDSVVLDGRKAVEAAEKSRPDILFTCIALPGIDGLELAKKFKSQNLSSAVLIGSVQADKHKKALDSGADAFIEYPATEIEILAGLDAAMKSLEKPSIWKSFNNRTIAILGNPLFVMILVLSLLVLYVLLDPGGNEHLWLTFLGLLVIINGIYLMLNVFEK